jgi:hypothetical protein
MWAPVRTKLNLNILGQSRTLIRIKLDLARRIAANVAKMPDLFCKQSSALVLAFNALRASRAAIAKAKSALSPAISSALLLTRRCLSESRARNYEA